MIELLTLINQLVLKWVPYMLLYNGFASKRFRRLKRLNALPPRLPPGVFFHQPK
jgi:hypothetical protein